MARGFESSTGLLGHGCRAGLVSGMRLAVSRDDGEEPGCEQLLALYQVRRGVERVASAGRAAPGRCRVAVTDDRQLVRDLTELIEALDRRVPKVERAGERAIARDAAALRAKAVERLSELVGQKAKSSATITRPSDRARAK